MPQKGGERWHEERVREEWAEFQAWDGISGYVVGIRRSKVRGVCGSGSWVVWWRVWCGVGVVVVVVWHRSRRAGDCGCCGPAGCGERREGSPRRRPLPGIHFLIGRCQRSPTRHRHQFCDLERETATQGILGSKWNSGRPCTSLCGTSKTDLERETATQGIPGSKWNSGRPHTSLCGTSKTDLERETATQGIPGSKWNSGRPSRHSVAPPKLTWNGKRPPRAFRVPSGIPAGHAMATAGSAASHIDRAALYMKMSASL
jgi:hypothetical protein